jgi:hypothetical protein
MIPSSILNQSARFVAALATCVVIVGWHSRAGAAAQQSSVSVFPDVAVSGASPNGGSDAAIGVPARNRALALTSHLPWRAPIGHRQPGRADIQLTEPILEWGRQQERLNKELDRKLIICRHC